MTKKAAKALIDEALELSEAGDEDAALKKYFAALALDLNNAKVHYNVGLIYKYRGAWSESFKHNRRAAELRPEDEASQWNLAIAATALRDWKTARAVWAGQGMKLPGTDGPIEADFGQTPVRLHPDGDAEVVWARRICPVRARIVSIPFPESEVAFGDVVLHDGAPMGYRLDSAGNEKSVFNMLEMFEHGPYSTYLVEAVVDSPEQVKQLESLCNARELEVEDWADNIQVLCKACSEGRPHEAHDHRPKEKEWQRERRIAVAARDGTQVESVLDAWPCKVREWGIALER
jgi:tetratricopeptide (TPR) repeat protein